MDSSKAKTIFIVVFVLLNIFLMVNVVLYTRDDSISKQTLQYTVEFLKSRGIALECKIPTTIRYLDLLEYSGQINENDITAKFMKGGKALSLSGVKLFTDGSRTLEFKQQGIFIVTDKSPGININDEKSFVKYTMKLLSQLGMSSERLEKDYSCKNASGQLTVRLTEKYKGCFLFDNYVEASFANNSGLSIKYHYDNFTGSNGNNIIPAYQILLKNFSTAEAGTITDIDFGFMEYKVDQNTKGLYDKPVWRIRINNGVARYFKAFEGSNAEEIKLDQSN